MDSNNRKEFNEDTGCHICIQNDLFIVGCKICKYNICYDCYEKNKQCQFCLKKI